MLYELTLYDTESRADRAREYTESRRRAAVWELMPRRRLYGGFHHLVYQVREEPIDRFPVILLSRYSRDEYKALGDLHQNVRAAKALTEPQTKLLTALREADDDGIRVFGGAVQRTARRLVSAGFARPAFAGSVVIITADGREALKLRALP